MAIAPSLSLEDKADVAQRKQLKNKQVSTTNPFVKRHALVQCTAHMLFYMSASEVDHEPARLPVAHDGGQAAGADGQQGGRAGGSLRLRHDCDSSIPEQHVFAD